MATIHWRQGVLTIILALMIASCAKVPPRPDQSPIPSQPSPPVSQPSKPLNPLYPAVPIASVETFAINLPYHIKGRALSSPRPPQKKAKPKPSPPKKPVKTTPSVRLKSIVVDISDQKLYLYQDTNNKKLLKNYKVSTSKYGIGSQTGSLKTPLGYHQIQKKIGSGAAKYTIFEGRKNTGRNALTEGKMNGKEVGDIITTRIMWLKGLEPGINSGAGVDSYRRYIYIHGTAEEHKIGQPASHGCIRMTNDDVIDLFNLVREKTPVLIRK